MKHFQERTESPATTTGQNELLAAKALWFQRHDFSLLHEGGKKVWRDPSKELQGLKEPLKELLSFVQELQDLLKPAQEILLGLLRKKYLLELQLIPTVVLSPSPSEKTRKARKARSKKLLLTTDEIEFLKAQNLSGPSKSKEPKEPYDSSQVELSEEDAIYFTYGTTSFRVRKFSYSPPERGSSVKAPVPEELTIDQLERQTPYDRAWQELSTIKYPHIPTSTEFLSAFNSYQSLQKELQEDV